MSTKFFKATVHRAPKGGYWAEVDGLPGCVTEADTLEELKVQLKDAIQGWLLAQVPEKSIAKPDEIKQRPTAWHSGVRRELVAAF